MVFEQAQQVRSRSNGRVGFVLSSNAELTRVIFSGEDGPRLVATSSLEAFDETTVPALDPEEFLRRFTAYKLNSQLANVVYGYLASRTHFRPYQFLPVLRFLASPTRRLLIADEVGLGKTIEAGLILLELIARNQADRVLVVCPPHLREKCAR